MLVSPRTQGSVAGERKGQEEVGRLGGRMPNSRMPGVRGNAGAESMVDRGWKQDDKC
jgi:hypothetical protein